jgi:hypothetical protein
MKVEWDKSRRWYETHCGICRKVLDPKEDRVKSHAVFKHGEELDFLSCVPCAKQAQLQEAVKQTKVLGKKDAGP